MTGEEKSYIDYPNLYDNNESRMIDVAYQAWHKGFVNLTPDKSFSSNYSMSINDQYVFIRRMFHPIWSYYAFILRIFSFKLTFKELIIFYKIKSIKKINLNRPYLSHDKYFSFESQLIKKKPLVTIVLPTLNRYNQLKNILSDLENQNYKNFEIIIVDQSIPFNGEFYDSFDLNKKIINQKERALWRARNTAIGYARGDYILLLDDDSRVNNDWISEHLKCLDYFNVDISAGVSISLVGAPIPAHYGYFRWADQLDTGNTMLKIEVFDKCGLFDLKFEGMRMGDGEYGARAFMNGFKSINNPKAKRLHLKSEDGGLRETSGWDGMRPNSILEPRPIPSVLYFYRKYWGNNSSILSLLQTLPTSLGPYQTKGTRVGKVISITILFLFLPFVIIQVLRSWKISTEMLKKSTL